MTPLTFIDFPLDQEARKTATIVNTDMDAIERSMRDTINDMLEGVASVEQDLHSVEREEEALRAKCEKRKFELERSEKRLSTLQHVRCAHNSILAISGKKHQWLLPHFGGGHSLIAKKNHDLFP